MEEIPKQGGVDKSEPIDASKAQLNIKVEVTRQSRIGELRTSIGEAKSAFQVLYEKLQVYVALLFFWCCGIVSFAVWFGVYLLDPKHVEIPDAWTWQVVYYTAIRITIIVAIFWFASYWFKLLSSHIQMFQIVKHKRVVIDSLPGFVESGIDEEKRAAIFNKLIEIVTTFDETGIIGKAPESKMANEAVTKLLEILARNARMSH